MGEESEVEEPAALAPATAVAEAEVVRRQQDALLTWLVDLAPASSRRLLLWIGDGFDLEPWDFYRPLVAGQRKTEAPPEASLANATTELARTLAAYGWITMPLPLPEPEPPPRGLRLGKWRIFGLIAVREAERDPDKAEAYLELAQTQAEQGDWQQAEVEARRALHHFYQDPRTADRQAAAYRLLGRALEEQGNEGAARRAYERAADLDPSASEELPRLLAPVAPLEQLARATTGRVPQRAETFSEALESLRRRLRLTYQVTGLPPGELQALEVRGRRGRMRLAAPAWARWGTPGTVAAARLRQLVGGQLGLGGLALDARLVTGGDGQPRAELSLRLPPQEGTGPPRLRLSLASGGADLVPRQMRQLPPIEAQRGEDGLWRQEVPLETSPEDLWLALLVEELRTDRWGAAILDLEP